jgi:transposase InsO family protein
MHRNAPLTPEGRLRLCNLIEDGWPVAAAAESMRISRQTAHKWWRRYQDAGVAVPASTFHRVLQRHGVSRLSDLDRKGGRIIRRIETTHPGELVHIDVKKQAKIPKGGGWRVNGKARKNCNGTAGRPRLGYAYVHSAIDAHSRLAYSEIHADERATTAIGFWKRAREIFASYGITVERVLWDNGSCYRAKVFTAELVSAGIKHKFTRPYRPQTNGKVERFNRTLQNEWAYARPYRSEAARTRALDTWLHMYNHHRHHTAIGGPPTSRVNNLVGQNS